MQKWEYNIVVVNHRRDLVFLTQGQKEGILEFLDKVGAKGWEVIAVTSCDDLNIESRIFLKRVRQEPAI